MTNLSLNHIIRLYSNVYNYALYTLNYHEKIFTFLL